MFVNPMPSMSNQVGKPGIFLGFIDLNCGWYCTRALLDHWFQKAAGRRAAHIHLPKGTAYGFDPKRGLPAAIQGSMTSLDDAPEDPRDMERMLERFGPIIANGKLGGADWGGARGKKFGINHCILIVGADANLGTISYKDPLAGDSVKTERYSHVFKRIRGLHYIMNLNHAMVILGHLRSA